MQKCSIVFSVGKTDPFILWYVCTHLVVCGTMLVNTIIDSCVDPEWLWRRTACDHCAKVYIFIGKVWPACILPTIMQH